MNEKTQTMNETEQQGDADFVKGSLEDGKFYHGFCNDTFMPLVQPLTIEDPNKASFLLSAYLPHFFVNRSN